MTLFCCNGRLCVKMVRGLGMPLSSSFANPKQKYPDFATKSNGGCGLNA